MSELHWIAVPGGIDWQASPILLLRVLLVPHLTEGSLADSGMAEWPPQMLSSSPLEVQFSVGEDDPHTATVPPPHIKAEPGFWQAFFPEGTKVKTSQRRREAIPAVQVDDTSTKAALITRTFVEVAKAVTVPDWQPAFQSAVRDQLSQLELMPLRVSPPPTSRETSPEEFDFHRTVSMLREHPAVLRALGLIFDLTIEASHFPSGRFPDRLWHPADGLTAGTLRLHWAGAHDALPSMVYPSTRYGPSFWPAPAEADSGIDGGMVMLSSEQGNPNGARRWDVVTVDVDGGSRRLLDAARALAASSGHTANDDARRPDNEVSLPALRSAGLMLVRVGRQSDFDTKRAAAERNARRSMSDVTLTAEDLVLGYRIDIRQGSDEWLSLHQREGSFTVTQNGQASTIAVQEEGHTKVNGAVDDGDGKLRTDEVVARWDGWSLAVPRPNLGGRRRELVRLQPLPFDFSWDLKVTPGTLPLLRFGQRYRIRARVVDMAGGGLELTDPAADRGFTEPVVYQRYDPILSPNVRLPEGSSPDSLGPGESESTIIIRSDFDMTVAAFAQANPDFAPLAQRVLLLPESPLALAEQHGALDDLSSDQIVALATAKSGQVPDYAAAGVCVFTRREPGGLTASLLERPWAGQWPSLNPKYIELTERSGSGERMFEWARGPEGNDRLVVRLAKAEQLTLELSSIPREYFHFAIHSPTLADETFDRIVEGRHPMISPARRLTLVHAVRRPLSEPTGPLLPEREEGQTFVTLEPADPLLKLDPNSTGQLDVDWREAREGETRRDRRDRPFAPLQSIPISRGETVLTEAIRHEFGDTRHRMIEYRLTAVSRFRSFFEETDRDDLFLARTVLTPISIPSSARPAAPVLLSTAPAFQWHEEMEVEGSTTILQRTRSGGRLRVEMAGPWYETGAGEKLALVLAPTNAPPEDQWPFLTQAGHDPIHVGGKVTRWISPSHLSGLSGPVGRHKLAESGQDVLAAPYAVWSRGDRFYADIVLEPAAKTAYCPVVQLAVARYQPNSLEGLELSLVVKSEIVPLLPTRTLTVRRSGDDIWISLTGLDSGWPKPHRVDAIMESCQVPVGTPLDAIEITALNPPPDGFPAWVTVLDQIGSSDRLGEDIIRLQVPLGGGLLRVRVREVEFIEHTYETPPVRAATEWELFERVIFTDVIPVRG